MTLEVARALAPAGLARPFDPVGEIQALQKLAEHALRFSPLTALEMEALEALQHGTLSRLDPLYLGLILDLTGTGRLYAKPAEPALTILHKLHRYGFRARIGVAPTVGAAWALARFSQQTLTVFDADRNGGAQLKDALASFPIAALRLAPATATALQELGISTVAALLKLPRQDLLKRFGYPLIQRLDQLFGGIPEKICCIQPSKLFVERRVFEDPLNDRKDVQYFTLELFKKLFSSLYSDQRRAATFQLTFKSLNPDFSSRIFQKEISLAAATHNFAHIAAVLEPVLENLPIAGGVTGIAIKAKSLETAWAYQIDLAKKRDQPHSQALVRELLNNLVTRLGRRAVRTLVLHNSHIPEKSYSYQPVGALKEDAAAVPHFSANERPPYIFPAPEPIQVMALLPDRPPAWIIWRHEKYGVLTGLGPERITAEWWQNLLEQQQEQNERDYFTLQDQHGRWLWVFREKFSGSWFVHGVWS